MQRTLDLKYAVKERFLQRKKKANLKKEPNPFLPTSCLLAYMYA
jgi:hypothetical protein